MGNNFKMLARTQFGLEDVLEKELQMLGAMHIKKGNRSVQFVGDLGFLYKANLNLSTAINILKPIKQFKIESVDDLYHQVYDLAWEKIIGENQSIVIHSSVFSDLFNHTQFAVFKTKDAIVDRMRNKTGNRPDVDTKTADIHIHIHIDRKFCSLSLDSSGDPLFKRGYKTDTNIAPINEVLAAGMLKLSGWDGKTNFMDPMCGSGTLLIEAAMMACNIPPNINRKKFAFMQWKDWDQDLYNTIVDSVMKKVRDFPFKIMGYDKAPSAVMKAIENVANANLDEFIDIEIKDFFNSKKEVQGPLHMVSNPPYGERLEINIPEFYGKVGDTLKQHYPGTQAWMIVGNLEAIKNVGLKPSRKIKLYNGPIEARLVKYDIYEGSRR
ncbi:RNA methyltransferase [Psychroflexus salis]|uniref:RNA methyltransferase n=2 Tax=Psychroflexus salis TaxID=1526574 RepID=A0A916ZSB1_9FLAO|nr:RNA methyltransferase [Psychroflexus salis]